MNNYIGYFATSLAGHDKGLTYVITGVDNEYRICIVMAAQAG